MIAVDSVDRWADTLEGALETLQKAVGARLVPLAAVAYLPSVVVFAIFDGLVGAVVCAPFAAVMLPLFAFTLLHAATVAVEVLRYALRIVVWLMVVGVTIVMVGLLIRAVMG